MTWYTASLLVEGVHDLDPTPEPVWQEIIVLLDERDEEAARARAEALGREREHQYDVAQPTPHRLRWVFRRVERVCEVEGEQPCDGVEVFSRFLRASEVASLSLPFNE